MSKTRLGYWKHQTEREGPHSIKRRACGRNDNGTPYKGIQTDATDNLFLILWVVKSYGNINEKNNDSAGYWWPCSGVSCAVQREQTIKTITFECTERTVEKETEKETRT